MAETRRPLSPHLQVYRWQVQMVTSILNRATGVALCVGIFLLVWGLYALAAGADAFGAFTAFCGSPIGIILLIGWSWAFFFHLCGGLRHLIQDTGAGFQIVQFVPMAWASVIASFVLTAALWVWILIVGVSA